MLDEQNTRDLLMCFLFVLKNINPKTLHYWFSRRGIDSALFVVLSKCVHLFRYVGRQALAANPRTSAKQYVGLSLAGCRGMLTLLTGYLKTSTVLKL